MATIAEQLTSLANTKTAIKDAIVAKGVAIADTDSFSAYADKIRLINGDEGPATRLGVSIDSFIGETVNGELTGTVGKHTLDLSGVEKVGYRALAFKGFYNYIWLKNVSNVKTVINEAFYRFAEGSIVYDAPNIISFDSLEEINGFRVFANFLYSATITGVGVAERPVHKSVVFPSLKVVNGEAVFQYAFNTPGVVLSDTFVEDTFPALETISGKNALNDFIPKKEGRIFTFIKVKMITGYSATYGCTFGNINTKNTVWNFPSATEFTGYIWNGTATYVGEIHFAAANREAIEACEGYDYKWGFAGATIYFDLMLSITVNEVVYSREYTIGDYMSWKDTDGNIIYTDATVEPTIGTVVYSDQGTTQFGTVEAVA